MLEKFRWNEMHFIDWKKPEYVLYFKWKIVLRIDRDETEVRVPNVREPMVQSSNKSNKMHEIGFHTNRPRID